MSRMRASLLLPFAVLLAACGQRGDLYLPTAEREAVLTVPADATLPALPGRTDEDDEQSPATGGQPGTADQPAATGQ